MKTAIPSQWLSYAMVAAIGATAGWIARPKAEKAQEVTTEREKPNASPSRPGGKELLDSFIRKQKTPDSPPKGSFKDRFDKLSKTVPVSADPAADFQKLLAEFSEKMESGEPAMAPGPRMDRLATLGILLGQWMDIDANAAMSFMAKGYASAGGSRIVANLFLQDLAGKHLEKHGLPALMAALSGRGTFVESLVPVVSEDLSKRGSVQELQQMKADFPEFFEGPQMGHELGRKWPVERRDELLAILAPKTAAEVMSGIAARMEGSSGGEWILTRLRNGGISPELRDAMAKGSIGSPDRFVSGIPLQHRIDIMRELGTLGEGDEDEIKGRMIRDSLESLFISYKSEDDSLFSLHHGVLSAREVMEIAREKTVDPGEDHALYNSHMFRELAEENLSAAMDLLADMPPQEREKVKADAARGASRDMRPDVFLKLTESVNAAGNEELLQEAWNNQAAMQLRRFGAFYMDWVKSLPPGENKTRALTSIQRSKYPRFAAEAGKILKEP